MGGQAYYPSVKQAPQNKMSGNTTESATPPPGFPSNYLLRDKKLNKGFEENAAAVAFQRRHTPQGE